MSINAHPTIIFKVEIFTNSNIKEASYTLYCLGTNNIKHFVKEKRDQIGIKNYRGYYTQAIPLSSYTTSIIKKGLSL